MKQARFLAAAFVFCASCFAQGWVVLPIREYETLHAKAYPVEHEPEGPPLEATLTRVDYDLRVEGMVASGRARLTIDVLKDGWVRVPIPPGLLVREARLGGDLVSLVPAPGAPGQMAAVLSNKGRSVLVLDVAFTVSSAAGEERLSLPVDAAGVTRATVALAQQDVEVKVTGGLPPQKSESHWVTYARGSEPLVLTWRKRIEERRMEFPLRMRGSLTQLFGLGEDSTSLSAEVQIEVLQGAASQVRIAVPEALTINQVPGALVADWEVKNGELVVNFLDPVEHVATFTITGETRLAREGALTIPLLRLLDAEREAGGVAVEVLGAGEIKESKTQGLDPADASSFGQMVASRQSPSLAAFRPRPGAGSHELEVRVVRYAQQAMLTANIEEARYLVLMTVDGKTLVQAHYAVRNNQRNFAKLTLPAGAVVWSASVGGRPVRPGEAPDGSMLLPLDKSRAGEDAPLAPIEILYLARGEAWGAKGRAGLPLPVMDLPISRTGVVLFHPPLFRVNAEPGAFRMQSYQRPASEVLSGQTAPVTETPPPAPRGSPAQNAMQALVDRYRASSGSRKSAELAPVRVSFPSVGPSLFLVSELTGEGKGAVIELNYQRLKEGGVR